MTKKKYHLPISPLERMGKLVKLVGSVSTEELSQRLKQKVTQSKEQIDRVKQAAMIVKELGQLKGTAMKVGQILTMEAREYLPEEVVVILEQLQNKVTFMPIEDVEEILKRELQDRRFELDQLSTEPIAAASIGQVHTAFYKGQKCAVKIQYPFIQDTIDSDLKVLAQTLKTLAFLLRREIELEGLIREFSEVFKQETDYLHEARSMSQYRAKAKDLPGVIVPEVFPALSTSKVLVQSFEQGMGFSSWCKSQKSDPVAREKMGKLILDLYIQEFCHWGLVQTDPNPGNFLVRVETNELVLLDFGAVKEYSLEFRRQYAHLVMAIFHRDREKMMNVSYEMNLLSAKESQSAQDAYAALVFESMRPLLQDRFEFKDDTYMQKMRELSQTLIKELKFSPPPKDLIFLHRKLGGIYQMLRQLEVSIDLTPYIDHYRTLAAE